MASFDQEMLRGSARWLPIENVAAIGIDDAYVLGTKGRLAFVVPRADVRSVTLTRYAPARGPGGSQLAITFEDAWSSRRERRTRTLLESDRMADLDATATALAERLAVALAIEDALDE
jgi:hypothetical protein